MTRFVVLAVCLPALFLQLAAAGAGATTAQDQGRSIAATQKVVEMLSDMVSKAKQMKKDEEVAYAESSTWCTSEQAQLKKAIAEQKDTAESLAAEIEKLEHEVQTLGEEIDQLNANIEKFTEDKKKEIEQRAKDHKEFVAEEQDYAESVDALQRAIARLQKENYDRPGAAAALLQVAQKHNIPTEAKAMVAAFVSMMGGQDPELSEEQASEAEAKHMSYDAPEANAYEFQSGGIVEVLKKLLDEFRAKLATCQKEEMNAKHASEMVVLDLTDSIENSEKDVNEKTAQKEKKAEMAANAKKELEETKASLEADQKTLADITAECQEKKLSFEEKQQLRGEEIQALEKAIEILSSEAMQEGSEHLGLAQAKSSASFAQMFMSRGSTANDYARRQVRDFLKSQSQKLHSRNLALLAEKLAEDPFAKVKKMIDEMITRLLREAEADANHEGWCDKEMGQSKVTRTKLQESIDTLAAAIEEGKAEIYRLTEETKKLSEEIVQLTKSMEEATTLRQAEKAKNKDTVEDATRAKEAVAQATAVLKEFYAHASTATAFLQVSATRPAIAGPKQIKMFSEEWNALANPEYSDVALGSSVASAQAEDAAEAQKEKEATGAAYDASANAYEDREKSVDFGHKEGMQTFGETYVGQQDEAGGVLGLLEVIASDFATLIAETEAEEAAAQKAYEDFMAEAKKDKATKEKSVEMNNEDRAAAEAKLQEDVADLKATQDELLAADRYHAKLVPQCVDQGMTFEERTKAREAEIASLKEALQLLGGATPAGPEGEAA